MSDESPEDHSPLHALFLLAFLFVFGLLYWAMHANGRHFPASVSGLDYLSLCLATFRITELITGDTVTKFLRDPFVARHEVREPDGTVEEKVQPAGHGFRYLLGELVICPWCAGVWVGMLLTFFYVMGGEVARIFLLGISATAGGILFQLAAKLLDRASEPRHDTK